VAVASEDGLDAACAGTNQVLVLLLFGAKKVPEMARGLGQGLREFQKATREAASDDEAASAVSDGTAAHRESA